MLRLELGIPPDLLPAARACRGRLTRVDQALFRRRAGDEPLRDLARDYDVQHTTLVRYFARPSVFTAATRVGQSGWPLAFVACSASGGRVGRGLRPRYPSSQRSSPKATASPARKSDSFGSLFRFAVGRAFYARTTSNLGICARAYCLFA